MPRLVFVSLALFFAYLLCSAPAKADGEPAETKDKQDATTTTTVTATAALPAVVGETNATCAENQNDTDCSKEQETTFFTLSRKIFENREMLMRAFYVVISITGVVVVYFVVKTLMLRRKNSKSRKYGIVSSPESNLEMQPLDQADDDDDMTLYEARTTKLK